MGSSQWSFALSTSLATAAAVNALVQEAMRKTVSASTAANGTQAANTISAR